MRTSFCTEEHKPRGSRLERDRWVGFSLHGKTDDLIFQSALKALAASSIASCLVLRESRWQIGLDRAGISWSPILRKAMAYFPCNSCGLKLPPFQLPLERVSPLQPIPSGGVVGPHSHVRREERIRTCRRHTVTLVACRCASFVLTISSKAGSGPSKISGIRHTVFTVLEAGTPPD